MSEVVQRDSNKFVTFSVLGESYCLPITSVQEVLEVSDLTPVPNSVRFIAGVINLRGVILTVIDGSDYLSNEKTILSESSRILVFDDQDSGKSVGILVDSLSEIVTISDNDVSPYLSSESVNFIKGLFHLNGRVFVVLNEKKLFESSGI